MYGNKQRADVLDIREYPRCTLDDRDLVLHEVEGINYEMQNITKGAIATAVKNTEPNEQTNRLY